MFDPELDRMKSAIDMRQYAAARGYQISAKESWRGSSVMRHPMSNDKVSLAAVFKASMVSHAHAHRFRHTLATELLGNGASFEEVADILGNSPEIVRKHYAKWSPARQSRIDDLMSRVHSGVDWDANDAAVRIQ